MPGRKLATFLTAAVIAAVGACAAPTDAQGTGPALANDDRTALLAALDDEYKAIATYEAVIAEHGDVRPFINIVEAERRHASRAMAEMDRLGIAYPAANPYSGKLQAPATVLEACEQGREAEIENIALYDRILPSISDESVRSTLTDLQWASRERHLPAFERCIANDGVMGRGAGHGAGAGQGGHGRGHGGHHGGS